MEAAAGGKRSFLDLLEDNMQRRRRERRESGAGAGGAPLPQLLQEPRAAKRQRREQQQQPGQQPGASPAESLGLVAGQPAAAAGAGVAVEEPDPRLCLWEPPVSPYGLLGR